MILDDDPILVLEAESSKTPFISNEIGGLSAWSNDTKLEIVNRNIFTAVPSSSNQPSPKLKRRYDRPLITKLSLNRPSELIEHKRENISFFHKNTPTFTNYLNSLIAKNSSIITKKGKILEKQKKLEVVSVKLNTSNPGRRFKSQSPDKLNKIKLPKFFMETFLIHKKMPPSVSGFTMTVYPKTAQRAKGNNFGGYELS
jgi:hypothetical protein